MVSKFALFTNLLLTSAALAVHSSSPVEVPNARSREARQSSFSPSDFWIGAFISGTDGAFNAVSGTIAAPDPVPDSRDGTINFMVGIDGVTCLNRASILQAGVKTSVKDGNVSYSAWGMWNTNDPYYFDTLTIGDGDVITTAVVLTSTTTGTVFVQNEITGQVAFKMYQMDSINALCGASAEWLVSDAGDSILDTSGVILTRAFASGPSGHVYSPYNPQDGAVFRNLTQGGALVLGVIIGSDQNTIGFISSSALSE